MILMLDLKLAPEKSLCQLAVQSEVSKLSVHWAIILLKQNVYKIKTELNNSSSRLGSKKVVLQVVSRIRSQRISWPGTHVFLDKTWCILSGNVTTSMTDTSVLKVPVHVTSYFV